jgi:type II secretory pathway component GspD/PulD (secretin)
MQERVPAPGEEQTGPSIDNVLVTFTMRASPFLVLESIAKANDVALIYENGVWFIRPYNDNELIGRIYRLKYTPQERVLIDAASGNSAVQTTAGGEASVTVPNMNLQQPQNIFRTEEPALVQEIKNMLKIPSRGTSGKVAADEASVGNFPPLPSVQGLNPAGTNLTGLAREVPEEPSVTFNSDTNTIYIVATRQQHQWVEGFLAAADRPQALIGIEVKFFETTRDPTKEVGINWAGTLQGGYDINFRQRLTGSGGIGGNVIFSDPEIGSDGEVTPTVAALDPAAINRRTSGFNDRQTDQSGSGRSSGTLPTDVNSGAPFDYRFNDSRIENLTTDIMNSVQSMQAGFGGGYTAVLSPRDISFAIEAFMEDRDTSIVQYPRVLTVNNREVAISNARNEPILGSSATNTSGGASTQTSSIEYLPIGTQLNILPKTMPDGSVFLNVAITVSNILRFKPIITGPGQANEFPVTTSRVYQAALQVDSGYTLAVGGLEETFDEQTDNGVLLLKDIPGVGQLFKSKGRTQNRRNLIVFITPAVIQDRRSTTGISESPESVIPVRPGDPPPPAFGTDGRLVGGQQSLDDALAWLQRQYELFQQINRENRVNRRSLQQLEGVIRTAEMILAEIESLGAQYPARAPSLAEREESALSLLDKLNETLKASRKNLF